MERGVLLWRELGRLEEALADFDALLAEDPHYAPALINRALVAQNKGRYKESLLDLKAYLQLPESETQYREEAKRTADLLAELIDLRGEE